MPDWAEVQRELRHKHVTLRLALGGIQGRVPDGYQYSWFCERYREWRKTIDLVMRQEHTLGREACSSTGPGTPSPSSMPTTGEVRPCYLFVAVLGASNYTYAEPSLSQDLESLPRGPRAHVRVLRRRPRTPRPRQPKTGVTQRLATTSPISTPPTPPWPSTTAAACFPPAPTGPGTRPRWKPGSSSPSGASSPASGAARFFSLARGEGRRRRASLRALNERPFQKLPGSRRSVFLAEEQPVASPAARPPLRAPGPQEGPRAHRLPRGTLRPLLLRALRARPGERSRSATPTRVVEIFHEGLRVASHVRVTFAKGGPPPTSRTCRPRIATMPSGRRSASRAGPDQIGPETERLIARRHGPLPPPGAWLPLLPRHPAPGRALRAVSPGSGRRPHAWPSAARATRA